MKGAVMRFRKSIIPIVTLLVMSMGLLCGAETKTLEAGQATVSWKEKGVIDDLGDGNRVFSGASRSNQLSVSGHLMVTE
jgi:hypothetical protein